MIKAVLFDLDGTLIHMDLDYFMQEYFKKLGPVLAKWVEPKTAIKQLLASTHAMICDRGSERTNEQVFLADFFSNIKVPQETLMPDFERFYEQDFKELSYVVRADDYARQAVQAVLDKGLKAVVATQPVFPLVAVKHRLAWGKVDDMPFDWITSYEHCHYCKPHPEYYLEIAQAIGVQPQECLMVGNDVSEDLIAASIGMKTYLVVDNLINRKNIEPKADYVGTLRQLAEFLQSGHI